MEKYLAQFKEVIPEWLMKYQPGDKIPFKDFMSGRVGYYPGAGFDGNLIKVCNMSHSCHAFLYVDYMVTKDELEDDLRGPRCITGYHVLGSSDYTESDLVTSLYPLNVNYDFENNIMFRHTVEDIQRNGYCKMIIFERDRDRDDSWGAERFALTYLYADGISTYYQLFCREYSKAPWIFLLQDHGFGGNYDRFGKNGLLDKIIKVNECHPDYVICAADTAIWDHYRKVDTPATFGGMHHRERYLYFKNIAMI